MKHSSRNLLALLGPGVLYTAAAVGVSHLVYATRAGAVYGLSMIPFILFLCLLKYPALRFGSEFAAATGRSIEDSYISFGRWTLWLLGLSQLLSMVFIVAAIGLVTTFIDMTTVIAFLVGPLIAWLNHRSIFGRQVRKEDQPGPVIRLWSGIALLVLVSVFYVYLRITG